MLSIHKLLGALYRRYFGSKFDHILARTLEMDAELHAHMAGLNRHLDALEARLDEVIRDSKQATARHSDEVAMTRRIASLEDRLRSDGDPPSVGYVSGSATQRKS